MLDTDYVQATLHRLSTPTTSARHAAHHATARRLLTGCGLACVEAPTLPSGVVSQDGHVALGSRFFRDEPTMIAHELAHYLVAPASRRDRANYGLGAHPAVEETGAASLLVTHRQRSLEETLAAVLHVLIVRDHFDGDEALWIAVRLGAMGAPSEALAGPLGELQARGLLGDDGRVALPGSAS